MKPTSTNKQSLDSDEPKIAIVCDWLTNIGGAERVVYELHQLFPDAPIYTSQYDPVKIDWFKNADVRTTWLQNLPKSLRKFMPVLRALAFSRLDLRQYSLVISSSGAEAKGIRRLNKDAVHISYCHSPTHYYWSRYDEYLKNPGFGGLDPLARLGLKILAKPMRLWDYRAAQRPDALIANSTHIKNRIKEYYDRSSTVIFPPVDTERFARQKSNKKKRQGFVITGRQTPYKKIDLAVLACTKLGVPLTVIGNGPDHDKLKQLAGDSVHFVTDATDTDVAQLVASAQAFLFPGIDDFGIAPVEAMSAGTPVIAYKAGGALDYVIPGTTGVFFGEQTVDSLCQAIETFQKSHFNSSEISQHAEQFNIASFHKNITDFIHRQVGQ